MESASSSYRDVILQTSQALIKETLSGRKNTSPQNIYETAQLYSAGALRVACIGLQCIGFNTALYRGLLEHAAVCAQTGKWRAPAGGFAGGLGLSGSGGGATWSSPALAPSSPAPGLGSPVPSSGGVIGSGRGAGPGLGLVPPQSPTARLRQDGVQESLAVSGLRLPGKT